MISGINSSKAAFFAWILVFAILFGGLCTLWTVLNNNEPEEEKASDEMMMGFYAASLLIAGFPIGWATKRKITKWYAHIPTEEIKVFETNLPVALFRLIKCMVLLAFDIALLAIYLAFALIAGPIMTVYTLITGIVFMCTKKI